MSRRPTTRRVAILAAIATLSLGGLHAAGASSARTADATTPGNPVTKSASTPYTGIAPCRVVDTRIAGGPLYATVRHFDLVGNLSGQGGASNCGIPADATSIAANITPIAANAGSGYIRGWGFLGGPLTATLVNYGGAINASNMVNLPLCEGLSCIHAFDLRNYGADVHVVVDVLGYYRHGLFASMSALGVLGDASGVAATAHPATGTYTVNFGRDVDSCVATVTDTDVANAHLFAASPMPGFPYSIRVFTKNAAGTLTDAPFNLRVIC